VLGTGHGELAMSPANTIRGVGHIAVNTSDLDRFRRFYEGLLGLRLVIQLRMDHPPHLRHAALLAGDRTVLHVFEVPGYDPQADGIGTEMGERGRIDHFGFEVRDRAALEDIAARLAAAGAGDGVIRPLGPTLSVFFRDPDGLACEVTCMDPTWVSDLLDRIAGGHADELGVEARGPDDLLTALLGGPD
jgi:catechol 2,3-dioxygenase-like lactoylglutathione lyase family enzyme